MDEEEEEEGRELDFCLFRGACAANSWRATMCGDDDFCFRLLDGCWKYGVSGVIYWDAFILTLDYFGFFFFFLIRSMS